MYQDIGQKVYVVDDDDTSRQAFDSMLRSVGYEVALFSSGTALLDHAAAEGLAGCIVLDVRMQGLSGLEVQKRLAASGIVTPVIIVTGYADVAMAVQAMKANAVEFLTKPFREQDLLDAVGSAMERSASLASRQKGSLEAARLLSRLSNREYQAFVEFCQGHVYKQVAFNLGISDATAKVYRRAILHKLEVKHMNELILTYAPLLQDGLIRAA